MRRYDEPAWNIEVQLTGAGPEGVVSGRPPEPAVVPSAALVALGVCGERSGGLSVSCLPMGLGPRARRRPRCTPARWDQPVVAVAITLLTGQRTLSLVGVSVIGLTAVLVVPTVTSQPLPEWSAGAIHITVYSSNLLRRNETPGAPSIPRWRAMPT